MSRLMPAYPIHIPTYRRGRVLTYQSLPDSLRRRVVLVVEPGARVGETCPLARVWETDQQGKGAVFVKQAILDRSVALDHSVCIMMDDDLVFQEARWEEGKKRFRRATPASVVLAVHLLTARCREPGVAFSSFSTPFFNSAADDWLVNKRMVHTMFINVAECGRVRATFSGIPTMSDVKFSLECYTSGLRSWTYTMVAAVDRSRSGDGGEGAAIDRGALFKEAIDYLVRRWPQYIRVRDASNNLRHRENIGCLQDISYFPTRAFSDAVRRGRGDGRGELDADG
jgi:hypothetical protein